MDPNQDSPAGPLRWRRVIEAITAHQDLPDIDVVIEDLLAQSRGLVGCRYAALAVASPEGDGLDRFVTSGIAPHEAAAIGDPPIGRGLIGHVMANPAPLRLRDLRSHHDSVGFPVHHPPMRSLLAVPVRAGDRILGVLIFTEKEGPDPSFDEDDEFVAVAVSVRAASLLERARLTGLQVTGEAQMSALFRAVEAISTVRDPAAVLQVIVDASRDLVGAEYASLGVIGENGQLQQFMHSGLDPVAVQRIGEPPTGRGLLGTITVEGRPMRLRDLTEHPSSVGFPAHHPPMKSFLGVPIRSAELGVIGNIYLANKLAASEFTPVDEALISAIAGQAAIAIENSRSYDRERQMVSRMEALVAANLTLTKELRLESVLQRVVEAARSLADAEYAALGVLADDGSHLRQFVHAGMSQDMVDQIGPLPSGRGVMRAVMVSNRPIRIRRLADHPASVGFPAHHPPMDAFLGVPVEYLGTVFGNLYLTNKRGGGEFTDEDELVVSSLAAQAAVSIANARTYAREQELVTELRSLNEAKSEFVSTVSHELRTPLAALTGLAQTLARHRDDLSEDDIEAATAAIGRQAVRLNRLVDDLLDLSRMESGQVVLETRTVDVASAVAGVVGDALVKDSSVTISTDTPPGLDAQADPDRLDQVLVNLLANALRFASSSVVVSASRDGDGAIVISVTDDGPGVSPDMVPRLFERFARGRNPGGGTGLGLAISRALVEAMSGSLRYEAAPSGGASFHVTLREAMS